MNTERCFELKNRLVGYFAVVAVFLFYRSIRPD